MCVGVCLCVWWGGIERTGGWATDLAWVPTARVNLLALECSRRALSSPILVVRSLLLGSW